MTRPPPWASVVAMAVAAVIVGAFAVYVVVRTPALPASARAPTAAAPTSTAPTTAPLPARPLTPVRNLIAGTDPLTISILGDSTGDEVGEWVDLWAQHLAEIRAVTYHGWDDAAQAWQTPVVYSTSGSPVEIWNRSSRGRGAGYPADKLELGQPEEPDLVIYNFGHQDDSTTIKAGLDATINAVTTRWGHKVLDVAVLQNPALGEYQERQEKTVSLLRSTVAPELKLPTIDVNAAFEEAGPLKSLMVDDANPNERGSRLWTDTVIAAIG